MALFASFPKRVRWSLFGVVIAATVGVSFLLDDWAAEIAARPISSGQTRATLSALKFFGDGAPLVMLTVLACLVAPKQRTPAVLALAAALTSGLVADQAKKIPGRRRPIETLPAQAATSWRNPENNGRNSSFPSGHSAAAFAFARGMSLAFPVVAPIAYTAAVGTAVSRMSELRHFLSDCVVGGLLGWSIASLLWLAWAWVAKPVAEVEDLPNVVPMSRSA